MQEVVHYLFSIQDIGYREFQAKLVPSIPKETIIGVRVPMLRILAKDMIKRGLSEGFLRELPHTYYEENMLHSILLSASGEHDVAMEALDVFLPFVDNWAVCDAITPKVCKKHEEETLPYIDRWLDSGKEYTIRASMGLLMQFYLGNAFKSIYLEKVVSHQHDTYYVKMMVAWFFATALIKQYEASITYIEERRLEKWTHNKTIQKAVESFRITKEKKTYLRSLRIPSFSLLGQH